MASKSYRQSGGIPCPACGAVRSRVPHTTAKMGVNVRDRVCLECGHEYQTFERLKDSIGKAIVHTQRARKLARVHTDAILALLETALIIDQEE